jgi:hypothetical protein
VPRQLAIAADHAVSGAGDDKGDARLVHVSHLAVSRRPAKRAIASV